MGKIRVINFSKSILGEIISSEFPGNTPRVFQAKTLMQSLEFWEISHDVQNKIKVDTHEVDENDVNTFVNT